VHGSHPHTHSANCGYIALRHGDHLDYAHDGHLHHPHGDHIDECALPIGAENPAACTPSHACDAHPAAHRHGASCGHERVLHGDHTDYLVAGHLHQQRTL